MFSSLISSDIGVDFGTTNTVVYVRGSGIVLREPSIAVVRSGTSEVLSVGEEAKGMIGRTPADIVAVRPLKDGVIADFEVAEEMLKLFIFKAYRKRGLIRPRIAIAVPAGITEVEKRAVRESTSLAWAREVFLIEETMAAAFGVGLPVKEKLASMIANIGGGTTEIALIANSRIVQTRSIRIAGDELDRSITSYMRRTYNLAIGEKTSERIKIEIGSAATLATELKTKVKGRDLVSGLPRLVTVTSGEIREAFADLLNSILESIQGTIDLAPAGLSADLKTQGLVLAGGGALLRELAGLIASRTNLPVKVAEDPMSAVAVGTGKLLKDVPFLRRYVQG